MRLSSSDQLTCPRMRRLKAAEVHLNGAKGQHRHRTITSNAKQQSENGKSISRLGKEHMKVRTMHYSFDYAQNVSFPSNPQQPGPAYFKSVRKCGIFGVSCEPLTFQVNYLIDEGDDPGKVANATVSMVHHFLESHGVGEQHLKLHADNCIGQNKNNVVMQYLMWRIMTSRNKTIEFSFMVRGHTKFAPDRFF